MKKIFNKNNKGFTLIELIVVIAVIAILAVVASPQLIAYVEKSRVGADKNALGEVGHAAETAYVKNSMKEPYTFKVRIYDDGTSSYGAADLGTGFAADVNEILPENSYIYKSETYRGQTVTILITEGVATIEGILGNGELSGPLNTVVDIVVDGANILAGTFGGQQIDKEKVKEIASEVLFEAEAKYGSWENMTQEQKDEVITNTKNEAGICICNKTLTWSGQKCDPCLANCKKCHP